MDFKQIDELVAGTAKVFVLDKKTKLQSKLEANLHGFVKNAQKEEKDLEYLKTPEGYIFIVSAKQNEEKLRIAGHTILTHCGKQTSSIQFIGEEKSILLVLEGLLLGSYQFLPYLKDRNDRKYKLTEVVLPTGIAPKKISELHAISDAVFWVRDRVNEPFSHLNAEKLAERVVELTTDVPFMEVTVLEKTQIESLKMGGLLAVNKGSLDPPTFTILEYKPKNPKNKKPIILVGKGVVYDTGGLSIKPTPGSMDVMKSDMAGAATMAGAVYLAAKQKLNLHLVALLPATDNRPGGNAYAPGDVITMYDGTTVEVLNTDAEGRMILADALAYANKYKPELVIDAATLTGAAVRAIGTHASIVMGNAPDRFFEQLESAGFTVHERVVRFPFWDEYGEEMKSKIADLKNIGGPNAGMITAGKFLEHFVKYPYIHMDIAGPSWLDAPENYKGLGGTAAGVRLLYQFLKDWK